MERKLTGMARKVDDLGRIVLPAEIRRSFDIGEGDLLDISVEEGRIVLQKVQDRCVLCGSDIDLFLHEGKLVCLVCRKALATSI
jgi:transcriptional pleiotropic regulator of transition state genes